MIDVDHFKRINDLHGHSAGDQVLRRVAETIVGQLRDSDVCGRLGGEEFGVLLPHADRERAVEAGERLRGSVARLTVSLESGATVRVTLSIGVGTLSGPEGDLDSLLQKADRGLYQAKAGGRDRVIEYLGSPD
jgi:diguanylate cyclase (GGDEF)-like protein